MYYLILDRYCFLILRIHLLPLVKLIKLNVSISLSCSLHNKQRVTPPRVWTNVLTCSRLKHSRIVKERTNNEDVFQVTCLQPNSKCFRWEASVAHRYNTFSSWPQDTCYFFKDSLRLVEVVYTHYACHFIKWFVLIWKGWVVVQIFDIERGLSQ